VLTVGPGDYRLLESALAGATLVRALEAAVGEDPGFDPAAGLARWVEAGVIVDLAECGKEP